MKQNILFLSVRDHINWRAVRTRCMPYWREHVLVVRKLDLMHLEARGVLVQEVVAPALAHASFDHLVEPARSPKEHRLGRALACRDAP
jgi:hypothetical protein